MKKIPLPYLLIIALTSALWLPNLLAKGMFMDGVYDAMFAHNLAKGITTFWAPQTIHYSQPAYWDNPPLSMFLLSCFYKIFGDHYIIERIYSLLCAVIQLILIGVMWKVYLRKHEPLKKYFLLPCLLWLISPLTGWCYSNNMMENTMSNFTTTSLIIFFLFLRSGKKGWLFSFIGGGLIFLALITKGPTGLFPLAAPVVFLLSEKELTLKKGFIYALTQVIFFLICFAVVFSMDAPKIFFQHYLEEQLKPTLTHTMQAKYVPYKILSDLLLALLPLLGLSAISFYLSSKKDTQENPQPFKKGLSFLLLGFSASLPIVLSTKQSKFYLLQSIPIFAMAFAFFSLPLIKALELKISGSVREKLFDGLKIISLAVIVFCIFLCFKNRGSSSRDEVMLTDIEAIQPLLKSTKLIYADWALYDAWALRGYLNRLYDEKLCMPDEKVASEFYMVNPDSNAPSGTHKIYVGKTFDLYQF